MACVLIVLKCTDLVTLPAYVRVAFMCIFLDEKQTLKGQIRYGKHLWEAVSYSVTEGFFFHGLILSSKSSSVSVYSPLEFIIYIDHKTDVI